MLLRAPTRPLLAPLAAILAAGSMACEPMEPSGAPLSPVPVHAAMPVAGLGGGAVDPSAQGFEDLAVLSSDDLKADPTESTGGGGPTTKVGSTMAPAGTPATDAAEPATATAGPSGAVSAAPASATMAWPVRLVRTHLDEQPPSAVLAMPDGRRIVVSPGDMVPERGLVVMAIGKDRVHLAEINTRGDHATVVPLELTAQY